jgi:zinc protease
MTDAARKEGSLLSANVQRRTLSNGLTVLVKEDHAAEVVAVVCYVKAGYFHESDEMSGVAHFIEHMYFNGTPTRPGPEDMSRETKGLGGSLNAGTIYDRTNYYVVLPSEHWVKALEIQADAYQNPLFDAQVLEKEREAILQEARRKLDSPTALGREKMFELAFQKHRMRRWRIGQEETLRELKRDDLLRFYEDHYRPQNTVLCVVGDVDAEAAFTEIERLYGPLPKGNLRKRGGPAEGRQREFRYGRIESELAQNYTFFGFHTPGEGHEDNPALEILATVLGAGRSSRLGRRLQEELSCVTQIGASCYQFEDVGMFEISATSSRADAVTKTSDDLDRSLRETWTEVVRIQELGVGAEEIERARGILRTSEALGLEEVLGQAQTLAHYEALGGYEKVDEELQALNAVTAEDVQRVAREYLRLENATLLEHVAYTGQRPRAAEAMAAHLRGYALSQSPGMKRPSAPEAGETVLPAEELAAFGERFLKPERGDASPHRFELPNGATLVVKENHHAPTVAIGAYFRGGRVDESQNRAGLTRMMQRVLVKETRNRSAEQLAAELEARGASIGRVSTDDYFAFSTGGLSENLPIFMDIMFDILVNPKFSAEQLEKERELQLAAVARIEDSPAALANHFVRQALYQEHPYGQAELGMLPVIQNVSAPRLRMHYEETVRPEAMVLCVVGDVDAQAVFEIASRYVFDWQPAGEDLPRSASGFYSKERLETPPALFVDRVAEVNKDRAQSTLIVAFRTVPHDHPDTYPLEVLASITGGLGGTFFEEIRGKRGLAYQVSTYDVPKALDGYFAAFVACTPDSIDVVRELLDTLSSDLAVEPPDQESLARAQAYLVGSSTIAHQRNAPQLAQLAELELLGSDLAEMALYPEHIRAVTRDDLARVASEYFLDRPTATAIVHGRRGRGASPQ